MHLDGTLRPWHPYKWLDKNPTYESRRVQDLKIISNLAAGLEAINKSRVIHRGLKPTNIICKRIDNEEMIWKICDFGFSKGIDHNDNNNSLSIRPRLREYSSPEGEMHTKTKDSEVYIMGLIFLEILYPFSTFKRKSSVFEDIRIGRCDVRRLLGEIPQRVYSVLVGSVVLRMLNNVPDQRPSAEGVLTCIGERG